MRLLFLIFFLLIGPSFLFPDVPLSENESIPERMEAVFFEVAEKARPSVISVRAFYREGGKGPVTPRDFFDQIFGSSGNQEKGAWYCGSGFFITQDGFILTDRRLVCGATRITVFQEKRGEIEAEYTGGDPVTGIALLRVKGEGFPYLEAGRSEQLRVGRWVMAVGYSHPTVLSFLPGNVSAVIGNRIQTNTPGVGSGAPLLNMQGDVIGVIGTKNTGEGGSFSLAFSVDPLVSVVRQLLTFGEVKRGYIGLETGPVPPGAPGGVTVVSVVPGSPAEAAGIRVGDLLLECNGKKITSPETFADDISLCSPGTEACIVVAEKGNLKTVRILTEERPKEESEEAVYAPERLGIDVRDFSDEEKKKNPEGILIVRVSPGSPLDFASVKPGNVILALDREKISSVEEFYKVLSRIPENKRMLFLIRSGKMNRFVTVQTR